MNQLAKDYGITIVAAVIVAILIRVFLIEAYRIPANTMRPTLEPGDTIFVAKWPYAFSAPTPARGEVIVFSAKLDETRFSDSVKRVIGLPGETVAIQAGRVKINGEDLRVSLEPGQACGKESVSDTKDHGTCWEPPLMQDLAERKIPDDSVIAISDLRSQSSPGQATLPWALVPLDSIKGRALWIWLSIDAHQPNGWFPRIRFQRMFRRVE